jgi:hypothetical protein
LLSYNTWHETRAPLHYSRAVVDNRISGDWRWMVGALSKLAERAIEITTGHATAEESNLEALSRLDSETQRSEQLAGQIENLAIELLKLQERRTRLYKEPQYLGPGDLSDVKKLTEDLERARVEARRMKRTNLQPTTSRHPP